MTRRNAADTVVPIKPPTSRKVGMSLMMPADMAMSTDSPTTIVE